MECRHHWNGHPANLASSPRSSQSRDAEFSAQQILRRWSTERDDHLRSNDLNLRAQVRRTFRNLFGARRAKSSESTLENVRDVDLRRLQLHRANHFVEFLAALSREWFHGEFFCFSGHFTDEEHFSARAAAAEDAHVARRGGAEWTLRLMQSRERCEAFVSAVPNRKHDRDW